MEIRAHQCVKVTAGKYDGLLGVVAAVDQESGRVQVELAGVVNGEKVQDVKWYAASSLEVIR